MTVANMNNWALLVGIFLLLHSCSRPVANFRISQSSKNVPSEITFIDESENADSLVWLLNSQIVSEDSVFTKRLLLSGKYDVKLKAMKGKKSSTKEKEIILSPPEDCLLELKTRFGSMIIKLFDETPKHRDNFLELVESGYYNGLLFHRVIEDFMIQGGDPESRNADPQKRLGSGGPGYQIEAEFSRDLVHLKGALAAARTGDAVNPERKSSGSQFYIVKGTTISDGQLNQIEGRTGIRYPDRIKKAYKEIGGTPFLDYQYTVFGQVVEGLDIIDKISKVSTNQMDRPVDDIEFEIIVIK